MNTAVRSSARQRSQMSSSPSRSSGYSGIGRQFPRERAGGYGASDLLRPPTLWAFREHDGNKWAGASADIDVALLLILSPRWGVFSARRADRGWQRTRPSSG